jgi:hypothetical protein
MVVCGRPGVIAGDGNCLFNSLSLLITGKVDSAAEIRHRTAVELIINSETYTKMNKWAAVSGSIADGTRAM